MSENSRVIVAYIVFRSCSRGAAAPGTGVSHPIRMSRWLRLRLKIRSKAVQPATTPTRPSKPGWPFIHSKTETLGFGPYSLESMRGSAAPVTISLYPG
jgi:hypothetical protein